MRYLSLFFVFIITLSDLKAQTVEGCGTVFPPDYTHSLSVEERSQAVYAPGGQRAGMRWVAVWYHIITKNDGTGGASLKDVFDSHCELNSDFNPFDIGFFIQGIDTIKNTTLWNYQSNQGFTTFNTYNIANVCNVYVNGNLPGLCGFATFPSGTSNRQGGIFMNKSCMGAGTKTYPHEMGHYLNLPHTFEDGGGIEFVNGSNCATAGDGFCDTPADFIDFRAPCPYLGDSTDPNGDLYKNVIDETLFMSYFNDGCINKFSAEQQAEMNSILSGRRSYIVSIPAPNTNPLDSAVIIYPQHGDVTVNSSAVQFKWNSIPGAKYYNLRVQSATSTLLTVDTLITDTAYTISTLVPNRNYKFRVRAFSYGNTCAENANYQFFQTSPVKATVVVTPPSCAGENTASIAVNATSGTAPYAYEWSNGAFGSSVDNLAPGNYTVTVFDNNGNVAIANVTVSSPAPIMVSINNVGNNLNANVNGGTPPYTYSWSNGVDGPFNNNIQFGSYTLTVTDAKGCETVQTFVYSSLGVDLDANVSMQIFPNPVHASETVNIIVELNVPVQGIIYMVNVNGEIIQQIRREFSSGVNNILMETEALPSGIYLVQAVVGDAVHTQRVSVIR